MQWFGVCVDDRTGWNMHYAKRITFQSPTDYCPMKETVISLPRNIADVRRFDFEGAKTVASEKRNFPRILLKMVNILKRRN